MDRKTTMAAVALAVLAMGCAHHAHNSSAPSSPAADAGKKGECWGINGCKGQGACGGPEGHSCAGQNSCKGKGWLSLTQSDCDGRGGKFKGG